MRCLHLRFKVASILIVSLWSVFLLSILAIILGYNVRQKIALVKSLEQRNKFSYLLEASVKRAIMELKKASNSSSVYLIAPPQNKRSLFFKENEIGFSDKKFSEPHRVLGGFGDIEIFYGIFDEERKININTADLDKLKRLFKIVIGLDEVESGELAASIIDWRDKDNLLIISFGSAEDFYYRSLPFPYEAKDSNVEILEELFLIKGINNDIFEKMKDYLTIYGDGSVNINTASDVVLLSMGLDKNLVDKIVAFRQGVDGVLGTNDDNFFDSPLNIIEKLNNLYTLTPIQLITLTDLIEKKSFTTDSYYFTIIGVVRLKDNSDFRKIECIVDKEGRVLRWQES